MLAALALGTAAAAPFAFRFSQGAFRDDEIFESATSTPSRYLVEIGRRLCKAAPQSDSLVIGNPLLPLAPHQLLNWGLTSGVTPAVLTDQSGFPIAYRLPRQLFDGQEQLLLLLSCVDGALDARLLASLTGQEIETRPLGLDRLDRFPAMSANGWLNPDGRLRTLRLPTESALQLIERKAGWRDLPFVAFHPYHAGDALFFALAAQQTSHRLYDKHLVCSAFLDVVKSCSSTLEPVELPMAPMARDGSVSKYRYFVQAREALGADFMAAHHVIFARLLRMHHFTPFHLIDHARFTLGDPMDSIDHTIYGQKSAETALCPLPAAPLRVLFHLNGGWPLKSYPLAHTRLLFRVLREFGWEITVLDRPDLEDAGIHSVTGGDTALLQDLILRHHLFVGADSYPLHFARLIMRRPSVALFGSTKACNHDAPRDAGYRALSGHLPCNSCLSKQGCPVFGSDSCQNYVAPQAVISALFEMASQFYGISVT